MLVIQLKVADLFTATSRLRLDEAIDMLAVDMESNPPAFDEENRIIDSDEVLNMCGSLVRLDTTTRVQNDMGDSIEIQTLTAAHSSVIDFLTAQPINIGSAEVFRFSRAKANLRMAETCLVYLNYISENDITLTRHNIWHYPFARLSAVIWNDLYQEIRVSHEQVDMTRLNSLIMKLFTSPTGMLNWIRLFDPELNEEGINFDVTISEIEPTLYYAALLGLPDIVTLLLDAGGDINQMGEATGTALYVAFEDHDWEIVVQLLARGANPNVLKCGNRDHALQRSSPKRDEENVNTMPETVHEEGFCGQFHGSALHLASTGNEAATRLLLSHGADVNLSLWNCGSPLTGACDQGSLEIATILVEAGADVHATNLIGHSALLTTLCRRDPSLELFEYLIRQGSNPRQEDNRGCNSLHYAARAGNATMIRILLEIGVDVNATDHNGWSPLHWAVSHAAESAEVFPLLLQHGCDKDVKDRQGRTALDLAETLKIEETAILTGRAQAPTRPHEYEAIVTLCDGCGIVSKIPSGALNLADMIQGL